MLDDLDLGTAGASARREYDRRMRQRYGPLVGLAEVLRLAPETTDAWRRGARGEAETVRRLARALRGRGVVLLHDRGIPGSRANIDHLAIGPGGVTVIDAKAMRGKVRVERRGGLFRERTEHLVVAGRDRSKLVVGVQRQVAAVEAVVADGIDVRGALCWVRRDELPFLRRLEARGIRIAGPLGVATLARRSGPLDADAVERLALELARRLPSR